MLKCTECQAQLCTKVAFDGGASVTNLAVVLAECLVILVVVVVEAPRVFKVTRAKSVMQWFGGCWRNHDNLFMARRGIEVLEKVIPFKVCRGVSVCHSLSADWRDPRGVASLSTRTWPC